MLRLGKFREVMQNSIVPTDLAEETRQPLSACWGRCRQDRGYFGGVDSDTLFSYNMAEHTTVGYREGTFCGVEFEVCVTTTL